MIAFGNNMLFKSSLSAYFALFHYKIYSNIQINSKLVNSFCLI